MPPPPADIAHGWPTAVLGDMPKLLTVAALHAGVAPSRNMNLPKPKTQNPKPIQNSGTMSSGRTGEQGEGESDLLITTYPSPKPSAGPHPRAIACKVPRHPAAVTAGPLRERHHSGAVPCEMPRLPTRVARLAGVAVSRQVARHQAVVAHSFRGTV